MKLKNHTIIIDNNNKKYDIFRVVYIDNNLSVCVTKKRFLNLFKKLVYFEDKMRFHHFDDYVNSYINYQGNLKYTDGINGINKKYFIFGYFMNELISSKELDEILDGYKVTNALIS
jgi:hypothetical protein